MRHDIALRTMQRGATLFVALMFLLILSLVAVVTLQGTTLEVKMSNSQAQQMVAFQASETMRVMSGAITAVNTTNRGNNNFYGNAAKWVNQGGGGLVSSPNGSTCSGSTFNLAANMQFYADSTQYTGTWHSIPGVFDGNQPSSSAASIAGNPALLMCANFGCPGGAATCANPQATAWATVYRIGTRPAAGNGMGISGGTQGLGRTQGGGNMWFEIRSQAQASLGTTVVTTSEYRQPIQN